MSQAMVENKGKCGVKEYYEVVLKDKNGNIKPIFQENALCKLLLEKGWLNPHTKLIYIPVISRLLGKWSDKKLIEKQN